MSDPMRKQYRQLTPEEEKAVVELKAQAEELHELLMSLGNSRELSVAKTRLEESVMWAVKHLTGPR
jgi:hypothetical protein